MALQIEKPEQQRTVGTAVADRRLYLTADKSKVVEEGDSRAAFLFATPGWQLGAEEMGRYALGVQSGRIVLPEEEAVAPLPPSSAADAEATVEARPSEASGDASAPDLDRPAEGAPVLPAEAPAPEAAAEPTQGRRRGRRS